MKVALIGDIHANLPALEAVLAHARQRNIEAIWNTGDMLGYGAFPDEVVQQLREENILSIAGNYDLKVLKVKRKKAKWRKSKTPEKWLAFKWAYDNLSRESRAYLQSLAQETRLEAEGKRVLITHAGPASNEEPITPETPEDRLRELAQMAGADIIVCGHSHQPYKVKMDGVWFVNTGSVGRSDDGDPRACYATLHFKSGFFQVRYYRVEYDVERAAAAIRAHKLPEVFAQMTLQGLDFDTVKQAAAEEGAMYALLPEQDERLQAVLELARSCEYEMEHTHQVTRLALQLFDELRSVHGLGAKERFWLHCAALLHDIGQIEGRRGHHKTSLRLILDSPLLPFSKKERLIVGSIARYHCKAMPSQRHDHFAALKPIGRRIVSRLAAILRVADGLDRTRRSLVESLVCEVSPEQIVVRCVVHQPAEVERRVALDNGQLLEQLFDRKLAIEWHTG